MTKLPQMMSAIKIEGGRGPASALILTEMPVPHPNDGEVLIRVEAAGVNRPDVFQRMGFYPPPPGASATLGLEVAGDRGCGEALEGRRQGMRASRRRRLRRLCRGGRTTCAARAAKLGRNLGVGAAGDRVHGFCKRIRRRPSAARRTLLLHGATSGIGTTAIQMAKAAGAKVIATARGAEKAKTALELGADVAIDTETDNFAEITTANGGADVVLDMVGGDYFPRNLAALKHGGRIVYIAGLAGMEITVPIMAMMAKQAIITGSTLRARSAQRKATWPDASKRSSGHGSSRASCVRASIRPFRSAVLHRRTNAWKVDHTWARSSSLQVPNTSWAPNALANCRECIRSNLA